jgi:hypothetical protein
MSFIQDYYVYLTTRVYRSADSVVFLTFMYVYLLSLWVCHELKNNFLNNSWTIILNAYETIKKKIVHLYIHPLITL